MSLFAFPAFGGGQCWTPKGVNIGSRNTVGFTYVIWFWLLTTYRAAELSAFTFATPIIGVFAGWLLLGDQFTPSFLTSVALVAAGILTINWPARRT
jgi:drug/metabolite transporter (DMT)-like permease